MQGPRKGVTLTLGEKGTGTMKRSGGITDFLKDLPANPVVAAGPDWTNALQLVHATTGPSGASRSSPACRSTRPRAFRSTPSRPSDSPRTP